MLFIPDGLDHAGTVAAYNEAHAELAGRRVQLLAVMPATAAEVRNVADDLDLTFPILSDPSVEIFREFEAVDAAGTPRPCSVVVDKTGTVASVTDGVVSPQEMLAQLDILEGSNRFEMAVSR
jgi:peroxiredoxin